MSAHASHDAEANKALVRRFWDDLYAHDFTKVGTYFSEDAVYDDVPIPAAKAIGPAAIVRKLTIGLGRVPKHVHHLHQLVAEGDCVVTEHVEDWCFAPDNVVSLSFVSVQVIRAGKIVRWSDYSNMDTLLSAAPKWWLEHIMAAWAEG
jgi:limonene-1,2-epoxide hydrolase